ncbi:hypothetical protein KA107_03565, partial [Candidatus Pacearchaeota archaeon]|nr:hypothetical protein [Candidatus Pacearchaeota archaeon]
AREHLALQERFPSNKKHTRLVGHEIEVYTVPFPTWKKSGELFRPAGSFARVYSEDLGKRMEAICSGELGLEESLGETIIDLKDGTVVRGTRMRLSHYPGSAKDRKIPNEYLGLSLDASNFASRGDFSYLCSLATEKITPQRPLIFKVRQYVFIDGESVFEKRTVGRPVFKAPKGSPNPTKFSHLVFTEN